MKPLFTEHFWGDKHHGFSVLYQNMKSGQASVRELADFIKECTVLQEESHKHCVKLNNKLSSYGSPTGMFTPVWKLIFVWVEKLAQIHSKFVTQLQEMHKTLHKYETNLHKIHKGVKDKEHPTLEAANLIQTTTTLVEKAKETYVTRSVELEKLKRDPSSNPKDLTKAETKAKKACDEYKQYLEKYESVRSEFVAKLEQSSSNFQNHEKEHLQKMRIHINTYVDYIEMALAQICSAVEEFKSQYGSLTDDRLLDKWVKQNGTGLDRPGCLTFEEPDLATLLPPTISITSASPAAAGSTAATADVATPSDKTQSTPTGPPALVDSNKSNSNIKTSPVTPASSGSHPATALSPMGSLKARIASSIGGSGGKDGQKISVSEAGGSPLQPIPEASVKTTPNLKPLKDNEQPNIVDDLISMGSYTPDEPPEAQILQANPAGDPPLAQPESSLEEGLNKSLSGSDKVMSLLSHPVPPATAIPPPLNNNQFDLRSLQMTSSPLAQAPQDVVASHPPVPPLSSSMHHAGTLPPTTTTGVVTSASTTSAPSAISAGSIASSASAKLSNFWNRKARSSKSSQSSEGNGMVDQYNSISPLPSPSVGRSDSHELPTPADNGAAKDANKDWFASMEERISTSLTPTNNKDSADGLSTAINSDAAATPVVFSPPNETNATITGGKPPKEKAQTKQKRPLTIGLLKKNRKQPAAVSKEQSETPGSKDIDPSIGGDTISIGDSLHPNPVNGEVTSIGSYPPSPETHLDNDSEPHSPLTHHRKGPDGRSLPSDSDDDWSDDDDEPDLLNKIKIKIKDKSEAQKISASTDELRQATDNLSRLKLGSIGHQYTSPSSGGGGDDTMSQPPETDPWSSSGAISSIGTDSLRVFPKSISFTPASINGRGRSNSSSSSRPSLPGPGEFDSGSLVNADTLKSRGSLDRPPDYRTLGSSSSNSTLPARARPRPMTPVGSLFSYSVADNQQSSAQHPARNAISPPTIPMPRGSTTSLTTTPPIMNRSDSLASLSDGFSPFYTGGPATHSTTGSFSAAGSRGPSPMTVAPTLDVIPLAVAITETVHARCAGDAVEKWLVKVDGLVTIAFPSAIATYISDMSDSVITEDVATPSSTTMSLPALRFSISVPSASVIDSIRPNLQYVVQVPSSADDKFAANSDSSGGTSYLHFTFNMLALRNYLRAASERAPSAPHYNLNVVVYKLVQPNPVSAVPVRLSSYWRAERTHTDIRVDYTVAPFGQLASGACPLSGPFLNLCFVAPVDGAVVSHQSQPESAWDTERCELRWRLTELSRHGDAHGSLKARLNLAPDSPAPSNPKPIAVTWTANEASLSGAVFVLTSSGWRVSLMRRKVLAGKYFVEPQSR